MYLKYCATTCFGFMWLRWSPEARSCEHGSEASVPMGIGAFLDQLNDCQHWKVPQPNNFSVTLGHLCGVPVRYKVKLSLCLIKHHFMKTWGTGGMAPPFLTSAPYGVRGQLHAPATLTLGKEPRYQLDRRLGGPQNLSGRCRENKNILFLPGVKAIFLCSPTRGPSLYRLSCCGPCVVCR
jgi:hypothetical protein